MTTALPRLLYNETDAFDYMQHHMHVSLLTLAARELTMKSALTPRLVRCPLQLDPGSLIRRTGSWIRLHSIVIPLQRSEHQAELGTRSPSPRTAPQAIPASVSMIDYEPSVRRAE